VAVVVVVLMDPVVVLVVFVITLHFRFLLDYMQ
jgi:hypothetical protein